MSETQIESVATGCLVRILVRLRPSTPLHPLTSCSFTHLLLPLLPSLHSSPPQILAHSCIQTDPSFPLLAGRSQRLLLMVIVIRLSSSQPHSPQFVNLIRSFHHHFYPISVSSRDAGYLETVWPSPSSPHIDPVSQFLDHPQICHTERICRYHPLQQITPSFLSHPHKSHSLPLFQWLVFSKLHSNPCPIWWVLKIV